MKLQTPLLLLASLITFASGEAASPGTAIDARSHPRDFAVGDANSVLQPFDLSKRAAPPVPAGKDGNKLHVWIRTDERPTTYDDRSGAKHDGLNQLIKDTGGRHKDVVIGNSHGHWEYGLQFEDNSWQTKPNGDGAKVADYAGEYIEVKGGHESYEYKGQVKDGRKTLKSIATVAKTEISGKTYNHKTYNCATFAQDLVNKLV